MTVHIVAPPTLVRSTALADTVAQVAAVRAPGCAAARKEMLQLAARGDRVLYRDAQPAHFTASALVVAPDAERFLLLHHAKLLRWLQPGGHADGDANLAHVAWREATEETGLAGLQIVMPAIDLDVHLVEPPGEPPHRHLDVRFLALAPRGATVTANHESTAQRWVGVEELAGLGCDPGITRMAEAALATRRLLGSK